MIQISIQDGVDSTTDSLFFAIILKDFLFNKSLNHKFHKSARGYIEVIPQYEFTKYENLQFTLHEASSVFFSRFSFHEFHADHAQTKRYLSTIKLIQILGIKWLDNIRMLD